MDDIEELVNFEDDEVEDELTIIDDDTAKLVLSSTNAIDLNRRFQPWYSPLQTAFGPSVSLVLWCVMFCGQRSLLPNPVY